jgi:LPXTG-motif cell wall-anchored protein
MRRLMIIVGLTAVLLMTVAMPALAGDGLLGSGAVPPEGGGEAPVVHTTTVAEVADTAGHALAATGIDAGAALMVGFGLVVAGGAAVAVSRKRATA